jgi:hypothetical protein
MVRKSQALASRFHNCRNRQVKSLNVTVSCVWVTHPVFRPDATGLLLQSCREIR